MWGGSNGGNIFANTVVCKARSEIPVDVTLGNIFNIRGAIHDGHRVEAGDSFTGWRGRCWQPSSYLYSWEVEALVADIYSNTWYIYIIYIYHIHTYVHMHICIRNIRQLDTQGLIYHQCCESLSETVHFLWKYKLRSVKWCGIPLKSPKTFEFQYFRIRSLT